MRLTVYPLASLIALPAFAETETGTYDIEVKDSEIVVFVYKDGVASRLAHDHAIQASKFSGTIRFDPAEPAESEISISIKARSLVADAPELLKRYSMKSGFSGSDRAVIEEKLKGDGQLDVAKHPLITFKGRGSKVEKDGKIQLKGSFTLHGVTRTILLPVALELTRDGRVHGVGEFWIKQSDYGYEPYSALFGAVRVKDQARIRVELMGKKRAVPGKKPARKTD